MPEIRELGRGASNVSCSKKSLFLRCSSAELQSLPFFMLGVYATSLFIYCTGQSAQLVSAQGKI